MVLSFVNIYFELQYINNPIVPETVNIESKAGIFEGSAEMSSDLYSLASVMYNNPLHNNFPARNGAEDQHSAVGRYNFMFYEVYLSAQY